MLPWCACFGGELAGGGGGCAGVGLADCLVLVGTLRQVNLDQEPDCGRFFIRDTDMSFN